MQRHRAVSRKARAKSRRQSWRDRAKLCRLGNQLGNGILKQDTGVCKRVSVMIEWGMTTDMIP